MAVLDTLSGFEFEDVFRDLGYENVRQADRRADEGRNVLMKEVVDEARRVIDVECKHTDTVGRPVIQRLHSAIATFDFDGPNWGMVVTTGRFTKPAVGCVNELDQNNDPHPIELIDSEDIKKITNDMGFDPYKGRIEILCDETLRPYDSAASVTVPIVDIQNIDTPDLPSPSTASAAYPLRRFGCDYGCSGWLERDTRCFRNEVMSRINPLR